MSLLLSTVIFFITKYFLGLNWYSYDIATVFIKFIYQFAINFLSIKELLSSLLITKMCSSYLSLFGMSFFLFTKYSSSSQYLDLATEIEKSSWSLPKFISQKTILTFIVKQKSHNTWHNFLEGWSSRLLSNWRSRLGQSATQNPILERGIQSTCRSHGSTMKLNTLTTLLPPRQTRSFIGNHPHSART